MNYLSDPSDEFIINLRQWCLNNPTITPKNQVPIPPWNKGIPHTTETKQLISERQLGNTYSKGKKKPYAKDNLKHVKHRAFGSYKITNPNGETTYVVNLKQFCSSKNLNYTSMSSLATGKWPSSTYKGYQCVRLGYVKIHQ